MKIQEVNCTGCTACYSICGKKAISMNVNLEGFYKPSIDVDKCVKCGVCEKVCPQINDKYTLNNTLPITYLIINDNEADRMISSSGGVFIALAKSFLSESNSVVYGASFDQNWKVGHVCVSTQSELAKITRSKYVQSDMGDVFGQVKSDLNNNKNVLFSGTPCQIAGLKSFLGKNYPKLILVDFICHGVPSPLVWKKYLKYFTNNNISIIKDLHFRGKNLGWHHHSLYINYNDGTYEVDLNKNSYMKLFCKNISLNECCYDCKHKKISRLSDITLADFWGVEREYPEFDDNKGTSFVLIHSEKGNKFVINLNNCLKKQIPIENAMRHNPSLFSSVNKPSLRKAFFADVNNRNYSYLDFKYVKFYKVTRLINYVKKTIHRGL